MKSGMNYQKIYIYLFYLYLTLFNEFIYNLFTSNPSVIHPFNVLKEYFLFKF
jgi:hypothetical protein